MKVLRTVTCSWNWKPVIACCPHRSTVQPGHRSRPALEQARQRAESQRLLAKKKETPRNLLPRTSRLKHVSEYLEPCWPAPRIQCASRAQTRLLVRREALDRDGKLDAGKASVGQMFPVITAPLAPPPPPEMPGMAIALGPSKRSSLKLLRRRSPKFWP